MAQDRTRAGMLRRAAGILVVLGFLLLAVEFHRLAPALPRTAAAQPQSTAATPDTTPVPGDSPTPTTAPSTAAPTPTPTASTPSVTPAPNRSGKKPGIVIVARPTTVGSFDVVETVVFAAPTTTVTFVPPNPADVDPQFRRKTPTASRIVVDAGEQRVVVPGRKVVAPTTVTVEAPLNEIELRYRLSGVTTRSTPAPAGRALSAIGPLTAGVPDDLSVRITVTGRTVRNLQCPHLPISQQACATGSAPRLRINRSLPWRTALVLVQLDLPRSP